MSSILVGVIEDIPRRSIDVVESELLERLDLSAGHEYDDARLFGQTFELDVCHNQVRSAFFARRVVPEPPETPIAGMIGASLGGRIDDTLRCLVDFQAEGAFHARPLRVFVRVHARDDGTVVVDDHVVFLNALHAEEPATELGGPSVADSNPLLGLASVIQLYLLR